MKPCVWMLTGSLLLGIGISSAMAESASGQAPGSVLGQHWSSEAVEKSSLIVTSDYTIGPEDVLEITVWRNTDLSKVVAVRPDGRISLPLIGDVGAAGRTAAQLAEAIAEKLKEFKENPQVSIVVKEVNSYAITLVQNRFCEFRLGQHLGSHDRRPLGFLSVKQPLDAGFGDS